MLQSFEKNATTDFHAEEYRSKITKIKFEVNVKVPNNNIMSWDVSEAKDKSVMAWVVDDGNNGYILTIAGKEKIVPNTNSQYLFYEFNNVTDIENLELLDTSNVTNMQFMFYGCKKLLSLNVNNFDTSNVENMMYMFAYSNYEYINLGEFDTSSAQNMGSMFNMCSKLVNLGDKPLNIRGNIQNLFNYANNLSATVNFRSITGSGMFRNASISPTAKIILNYTADYESLVDDIITNKGNSNL